eukprot:2402489-Prymnesium_polylepis.1
MALDWILVLRRCSPNTAVVTYAAAKSYARSLLDNPIHLVATSHLMLALRFIGLEDAYSLLAATPRPWRTPHFLHDPRTGLDQITSFRDEELLDLCLKLVARQLGTARANKTPFDMPTQQQLAPDMGQPR